MSVIINLAATTELEAVNGMLSAIGESPITDVDTATQSDVSMAVNILRNACREVQAAGWRFNTEFGLAIPPTVANFSWVEPDATTKPINIFTPPTGLISFSITPIAQQVGVTFGGLMDVEIRPSKQYTAGAPAVPILVFYDRARNRDGFPLTENRLFLYIDPVWLFNFSQMPEVARRYVVVLATRRFIAEVLGTRDLVGFKERDEALALRSLAREQQVLDTVSLLDGPDAHRMLGHRSRLGGIFTSLRTR